MHAVLPSLLLLSLSHLRFDCNILPLCAHSDSVMSWVHVVLPRPAAPPPVVVFVDLFFCFCLFPGLHCGCVRVIRTGGDRLRADPPLDLCLARIASAKTLRWVEGCIGMSPSSVACWSRCMLLSLTHHTTTTPPKHYTIPASPNRTFRQFMFFSFVLLISRIYKMTVAS